MATTTTTARPSNTNSSTATSAGPRPPQASPLPIHIYHSPGGGGGGGGVVYPVASSGRGFVGRMPVLPDQSGGYQLRGVPALAYRPNPATNLNMMRQHPVAPSAHHHHHHHLHQHQHYIAPPVRGLSELKASPSPTPPVPDSNGFRSLRDRTRDDALVVVRDRKARISDGASLYVLCRSWLRNGFVDENQPHYGDGVKSLPRPLPIPVIDAQSPKKEDEVNIEEDEEQESVDHLSSEDLLKMHIKCAKSVRARLREGRLKRIARYKTRLALLLPPAVEQFRNDAAGGN